MKVCFGWEWIVESWLVREAAEGNLSPELRRALFPDASALEPAAVEEKEEADATGNAGALRVAEVATKRDRKQIP
jgi:hypothetical protein